MYLRRMENQLTSLKQIKPVNTLYKNFYKRENGVYYVSYEFQGQGTRDLYMLANVLGAFKEKEIGQIAE